MVETETGAGALRNLYPPHPETKKQNNIKEMNFFSGKTSQPQKMDSYNTQKAFTLSTPNLTTNVSTRAARFFRAKQKSRYPPKTGSLFSRKARTASSWSVPARHIF